MRASWLVGVASAALLALCLSPIAGAQIADVPGDATTEARLGPEGVDGAIGPEADSDWYRFRAENGQRYRFTLNAVNSEDGSGLDPTLALYDAQGNQVAFNDDSGGLNSALTYMPNASSDIFVEARGFSDSSAGAYELRVSASEAPVDDVGNDASSRERVAPGQPRAASVDYDGDVDWFRLSVRSGQRYRIALDGGEGEGRLGDPVVRLIDRAGNEIASNDDSDDGLNSLLEYVPDESAELYVEAAGFGGEQTGAYTLTVSAEALPTDSAAGRANTRARIATGESVSSEIAYPNDSDWYRIRLAEGQAYRFSLAGSGDAPLTDPILRVRNSGGDEVAVDDDGGDGLNSYLEFVAPREGVYFLDARSFNDEGTGSYTLAAAEGDIPSGVSTDTSLAASGDYREGVLSAAGDRDWYRLNLEEGQSVRIALDAAAGADSVGDPLVVVYGPDGAELTRDDDGGVGLNSWLEFQATAAGGYFVEARGFSDDAVGRYAISITEGEIGDSAETAEMLSPGPEGRTSLIGAPGDVDWFAVNVVEGRPYRFTLSGSEPDALVDPLLVLYDAEGNEVARDDDGGPGYASSITFMPLASGTYFAAAAAFGEEGGSGLYSLRVLDNDVPASGETDEILDAAADDRLSRIDMPGDLDSYRIELESGTTYTIETVGTGEYPLADPFVAVLDGAGERVASDDNSGDGSAARLRFTPEDGGSYLVQVSGSNGATGWYQVKIARR
ncbi:MAG: pre-peptidase C-terminal domain-containing protein [Terricaulis sp.]